MAHQTATKVSKQRDPKKGTLKVPALLRPDAVPRPIIIIRLLNVELLLGRSSGHHWGFLRLRKQFPHRTEKICKLRDRQRISLLCPGFGIAECQKRRPG